LDGTIGAENVVTVPKTQIPLAHVRKTPVMKAQRLAALAAVLVIGSVTPARAIPVTYSTSGVFGSSGTNALTQDGVRIEFNNLASTTVNPPPATHALFGSFTTVNLPATAFTLVDTFTLTITQTAPGPGTATFTSTVGGTIFIGNSQAFVQFAAPLARIIDGGGFATTYRIVEGDEANPGRLELFGNTGQVSTLNGEIGIAAVPEPGTMALACVALPLLGIGYARNRRRNA
jgi:hypothetical protein